MLTLLKISDVIETDFSPVKIDDSLGRLAEVVSESSRNIFPVLDNKRHFQGYVVLEDIRKEMFGPTSTTRNMSSISCGLPMSMFLRMRGWTP